MFITKYVDEDKQELLVNLLCGVANKRREKLSFIKIEDIGNKFIITFASDTPITNFKESVYTTYLEPYVEQIDKSHMRTLYAIIYSLTKDNFYKLLKSLG